MIYYRFRIPERTLLIMCLGKFPIGKNNERDPKSKQNWICIFIYTDGEIIVGPTKGSEAKGRKTDIALGSLGIKYDFLLLIEISGLEDPWKLWLKTKIELIEIRESKEYITKGIFYILRPLYFWYQEIYLNFDNLKNTQCWLPKGSQS